MNDLTPEQRARALELYRLYHYLRSGHESEVTGVSGMLPKTVRAWLAVEAHVLASHECPDVESNSRVQAWNIIAQHPFFSDCYQTEGTLVDAMVAKLDAAPLPEPEPDPRVAVVLEWADDQGDDINAESLLARLDALAARGYLEHPKAGA